MENSIRPDVLLTAMLYSIDHMFDDYGRGRREEDERKTRGRREEDERKTSMLQEVAENWEGVATNWDEIRDRYC